MNLPAVLRNKSVRSAGTALSRLLAIFALLVVAAAGRTEAAATIDSTLQPPDITLGDQTAIIFTSKGGTFGDFQLPKIAGLTVQSESTAIHLGVNGTHASQTITRSFFIVPKHAGDFTIPAFTLRFANGQTIRTQPLELHVRDAAPVAPAPVAAPTTPPATTAPTNLEAAPTPEPGSSPSSTGNDWRLLILLLVPLGAIILILIGAPARKAACIAAAINLVYAIGLVCLYPAATGGYQFVMDYHWVNMPGLPPIHFHLGVDGISLPLVFLTAIVTFAAVAISPGFTRRSSEYYCYLLIMSLGVMGAFISLDLFFFYIFHEFALIPTFLLIGIWGTQNRQFASFQVTIYLMAGSLILLAGLIALVMALPSAARTFDIPALQTYILAHPLSLTTQNTIFPIVLVGFGILVGLFPFHSWAPPGYASAPPAAAMLHAGILKKFALYGLIRVAIPMMHDGFETYQPIILALLAGNFLYAGFITIAQKELPTMLGFSSIMHMGYLFLGIACWNVIGVTGAVVLMVAHGLSAALLFGLSGEIVHRSGENRFSELGGLAVRAPVLAILFSFASMASMGVPGLANFAGELMVFFGSFTAPILWVFPIMAIYGTVITAIFQLRAIKNIFYGPMPEHFAAPAVGPLVPSLAMHRPTEPSEAPPSVAMTDVTSLAERAPYVLLTVASLVIGFLPFLLIHIVEPTVALLPFVK